MYSWLLRRRHFVASALLVVLLAAAPPVASASFSAMLAHVIEAVNTAVDIWEKHTRVIEDHLDYAGGLSSSFGTVNTAFQSALATAGLQSRFRLLDIGRSEYFDASCFRGGWQACATLSVFEQAFGQDLDWGIGSSLALAAREYSDWEYQVADTWWGLRGPHPFAFRGRPEPSAANR